MSTRKPPRGELAEHERQERQAEVHRLHCRGLSIRAIGRELNLDPKQVERALAQAKAAIRKRQGEDYLAELAQSLTEGAWEDLADSWSRADQAAASKDWRSVAMERANRAAIRRDIAKFNGLDKIEIQLDLSPRLAKAFADAAKDYANAQRERAAQLQATATAT